MGRMSRFCIFDKKQENLQDIKVKTINICFCGHIRASCEQAKMNLCAPPAAKFCLTETRQSDMIAQSEDADTSRGHKVLCREGSIC